MKSVMVLSAASGAGHIRAADALVAEFSNKGISATRHVEVLKYTNPIFKGIYSDLYKELVNKQPDLLGWVYKSLDRPWQQQKRRLALSRLNTVPLVKLLKQEKPEIAICTHFLPAEILIYLKKKKMLDMPVGVVVTDIDVHAMWLYRDVDWYFVAHEETKAYMSALGIPSETIYVTGIPIDPVFGVERSKKETRRRLGLDPDKTTLLVSAGGFGVGPVEALIQSLKEVKNEIQIAVICGRNPKLESRIKKIAMTRHPIKVVGFTTEMDAWMAASDLLVGKAGGLTSAEALARGLVMVIVNPIPGQEERNSDHFLEEGVAIRCNNLPALAYKIDKLIDDKERFLKMQQNVKRLACPHAASDIVSIVMGRV
ncbi:MAG: glycosyltransferase [Nitrospirae bacterium]|nr:glycosyltransferase [Nitrospirota bacterium]